jgi:hypothetical protein
MKKYKSLSNLSFIKSWAKRAKIHKTRHNKRTNRRLTKRRFGKGG